MEVNIWLLILVPLTLLGIWFVVAIPVFLLSVCDPLRSFVFGQPLLLEFYECVFFWPFCASRRTMLRWLRMLRASRPVYLYVDCRKKKHHASILSFQELPPADDSGHTWRCIVVSDTHGLHDDLPSFPIADVLILCGNLLLNSRGADANSLAQLASLNRWLGSAASTIPERVVVAGSHDAACEHLGAEKVQQMLSNALYLQDEQRALQCGLLLFGSPRSIRQTAETRNHAFQAPPLADFPEAALEAIPDGIDLLVTHGPPAGVVEGHVGSEQLFKKVEAFRPTAHVFGHVAEAFGIGTLNAGSEPSEGSVVFANCASTDTWYAAVNPPVVLDIPVQRLD